MTATVHFIYPFAPSQELLDEWLQNWANLRDGSLMHEVVARSSAQWGADQELQACLRTLSNMGASDYAMQLQELRRPKPKSLRELALEELEALEDVFIPKLATANIRRAIEKLSE